MIDETLERAKALIGSLTPLKSDCGLRCGAACCRTDEDGQGGVYLFPGERAEDMPWGTVTDTPFGPMLMCGDWCDRERRPFACRIFPLTPVRGGNGKLNVRVDARARGVCPLARGGSRAFDPEFVKAVRGALRILDEDETDHAFLERWIADEQAFRDDIVNSLF